ncbi:MAG TPA: rhomboid family intramembrane serine protease, partial [Lacipirellulaceae bacterium]|nr:rhomboid family intramembrane serine protease [Lacipirellulaceae bacterium]
MLFPLFDLNPHRRWPIVTMLLVAINFGVTAWTWSQPERHQNRIAIEYGFVPARLTHVGQGQPVAGTLTAVDPRTGQVVPIARMKLSTDPARVYLTFLTTMFLHGGWMHLLMNMWMLWVFGNNIEDRLGHFVYLGFYLAGGIIATLAFWASAPEAFTPVIGASGAVAAVLGGYAVTFPTAKIRTLLFLVIFFTIIDMPALVWLGIWFLTQLYSGLMGLWGAPLAPVAFWAHIGG